MSRDIVISADRLGKKYVIGHELEREQYATFRDVVARSVHDFGRVALDMLRGNPIVPGNVTEEFWALRDVSFEVKRGEVVGIIGRNGAGKSTILKILSRITEPTEGRVMIRGRVASLLEVGTGFHPELTGRENIYLNGAILGMTRSEIRRKFDEIVSFAEVERFLDTPVKRYSSGMYVRLAFGIAAHLEPEVLIVDEVLAVGDTAFQAKCIGKMESFASKEGRTILFVSHNIQAISMLCSSAMLLSAGRIKAQGQVQAVIYSYMSSDRANLGEATWQFRDAPSTATVKLHSVRVLDSRRTPRLSFTLTESFILEVTFWVLKTEYLTVSFWVSNSFGDTLFATANYQHKRWRNVRYEPGLYSSWCEIPSHFLNAGNHYVKIILTRGTSRNEIELDKVVTFTIEDNAETRADYVGSWAGLVRPLLHWDGSRIGNLPHEPADQSLGASQQR